MGRARGDGDAGRAGTLEEGQIGEGEVQTAPASDGTPAVQRDDEDDTSIDRASHRRTFGLAEGGVVLLVTVSRWQSSVRLH